MSIKLKIKSKHLALEPAIIRIEERKLIKQIKHYKQYHQLTTDRCSYDEHPEFYELYGKFHSLNSHRRFEVRNEARATYLARAYIEGRKYNTIENEIKDLGTFNTYILPRVVSMVIKYMHGRNEKFMKPEAIKVVRDEVKAWCDE